MCIRDSTNAAQRLMALGQSEAQAIIHRLTPLAVQTWTTAKSQDITMISTSTIVSDIAAMKHETQEPRIFRT